METKMLFYGGKWVDAAGTRITKNPATGEDIMVVADADRADTDKAILAARKAFDEGPWSHMSTAERARLMIKTAELLEQNDEKISKAEADDAGKLYADTAGEGYNAARFFRNYAGIIGAPTGSTYNNRDDLFVMTVKYPIGVCAAIIPWNYPLHTAALSIAPALAAGNTVVLKPSSATPVTAILLVELMEQAGFPEGVINLVTGSGATVGDALAESPLVDQIMFTGGTDTGRSIMQKGAANIKRLELELGGKSPVILFEDCDLDIAIDNVLAGIFMASGQLCTAGSRLIVEAPIYDEVVKRIAARADTIKLGYGADPEAEMCTLISEDHMNKVLGYIEQGKKEGARLVSGGTRETGGELGKGFFVRPTVFADVTNDMVIAQEEIFGPVLVIEKFSEMDEAIAIANDSIYGLAGAVFTKDLAKAQQVIKRMRCGVMWVNTYLAAIADAPVSGAKQSGLGTISGLLGLESFMEQRQVNISLNPKKIGLF